MQTVPVTPVFEPIAPEAAGMPLYRVVKRSLLNAIEAGSCAPGQVLPSENELAGAMGVSIGSSAKSSRRLPTRAVAVRNLSPSGFVGSASSGPRSARAVVRPLIPKSALDVSRASSTTNGWASLRDSKTVQVRAFKPLMGRSSSASQPSTIASPCESVQMLRVVDGEVPTRVEGPPEPSEPS